MYYLLLVILYPVSLLPLSILYLLSDIAYVLLYHVAGYRKTIVWDNLRHAFPEKTEAELRTIQKKFYRSFCDQWIEFFKLLSISKEELNRRVKGNWEVFHQLYAEEKNTYALLGHTFNWEWASVACQYNCQQQFAGVYMPVDNSAFNKLLIKLRARGGGWLISMKAKKALQRLQDVRYIVGLIADQNPSDIRFGVWLPFMHREAPFFKGPEQLARRAKAAIVFAGIKKIKRGHYEVELQQYSDDASTLAEGEAMKAYVAFMEQQLREQPENWLWTHRRWKYQRDNN